MKNKFFEDDIDKLSNGVNDLIKAKDFKKAREGCQKLLDEYPDQVDGYERFAELYAAEGDKTKAIEYHLKTIDFMRVNPGFDKDSIAWQLEEIENLKKEKE